MYTDIDDGEFQRGETCPQKCFTRRNIYGDVDPPDIHYW